MGPYIEPRESTIRGEEPGISTSLNPKGHSQAGRIGGLALQVEEMAIPPSQPPSPLTDQAPGHEFCPTPMDLTDGG
jgi:hypothetical protein